MVDEATSNGVTPLVVACLKDHAEVATLLIGKGAAVDQTNISDDTPLIFACEEGHAEVATLLIDKGAAVDHANSNGDYVARLQFGSRPLLLIVALLPRRKRLGIVHELYGTCC